MSIRVASYDQAAIGRRIASARHAHGLTQVALAGRMDISQAALSLIETGRQTPSVEQLLALAALLDAPLEQFLHGRDRPGDSLADLAVQLRALGVVDLHVEGAIAPGAFLATEEVIAWAVSGREPSPRVVEAMPVVLVRNDWDPRRLHAEATIRSVEYRVAWLAAIALAIEGKGGWVGSSRLDSLHSYLDRVGKPAAEGWDGLGRPSAQLPKSPIWRRWRISYAADLDVFASRTRSLAQPLEANQMHTFINQKYENLRTKIKSRAHNHRAGPSESGETISDE